LTDDIDATSQSNLLVPPASGRQRFIAATSRQPSGQVGKEPWVTRSATCVT